MTFLEIRDDHVEDLLAPDGRVEARHRFTERQLRALNAALATARPLLVRGEPGIGKSQFARAAAKALERAFIPFVVDARTESRDLLWHFDAVGRLAEAQVMGALQIACPPKPEAGAEAACDPAEEALVRLRKNLAIRNFLHPRALWWALNWDSAAGQAVAVGADPPPQRDGGDPAKGRVVLIDEIDKAESDVPNGLLEALDARRFTPQGLKPVEATEPPPLVVITTNEERTLPDAFIRRCLVLHLKLPKDREALVAKLVERGQTHFAKSATPELLKEAAQLLADDRAAAEQRHWRPLPGQAEYLDLVRAVVRQAEGDPERQKKLIGEVKEFVLRKHPEAARELKGDAS